MQALWKKEVGEAELKAKELSQRELDFMWNLVKTDPYLGHNGTANPIRENRETRENHGEDDDRDEWATVERGRRSVPHKNYYRRGNSAHMSRPASFR